jgi:hypothetical protein
MDCPVCNNHCSRDKEDIYWLCKKCKWAEYLIPLEIQEGRDHVYRINGEGRLILLAEEILKRDGRPRPSINHRIRHIDGNYLNNTGKNLCWVIPDKSSN